MAQKTFIMASIEVNPYKKNVGMISKGLSPSWDPIRLETLSLFHQCLKNWLSQRTWMTYQSCGDSPTWDLYKNSWCFLDHWLHPFLHGRRIEKKSALVWHFSGSSTI